MTLLFIAQIVLGFIAYFIMGALVFRLGTTKKMKPYSKLVTGYNWDDEIDLMYVCILWPFLLLLVLLLPLYCAMSWSAKHLQPLFYWLAGIKNDELD